MSDLKQTARCEELVIVEHTAGNIFMSRGIYRKSGEQIAHHSSIDIANRKNVAHCADVGEKHMNKVHDAVVKAHLAVNVISRDKALSLKQKLRKVQDIVTNLVRDEDELNTKYYIDCENTPKEVEGDE